MLVIGFDRIRSLEECGPRRFVDRTRLVQLDQQLGQLIVGSDVGRRVEHPGLSGRRQARARQRGREHAMALVVGADRLRRGHESRLHPLGERLRLGDLDQELGQLVVTVDRLPGERHEPLVSRCVELAAFHGGLIVDPPRVVPG